MLETPASSIFFMIGLPVIGAFVLLGIMALIQRHYEKKHIKEN